MVTTVNTKGQVTVPGPLRARYGLEPGTKVLWIERDGCLIPRPVSSLELLLGSLPRDATQPSLADQLILDRRAESELEKA